LKDQVHVFKYIADFLDNKILQHICINVSKGQKQFFKFSSKMFGKRSKQVQNSLIDFTVHLKGKSIQCNRNFVSCFSDLIFNSVFHNTYLDHFHFDDYNSPNQQVFFSLFQLFDGQPFNTLSFSTEEIIQCFCIIGCPFQIECCFGNNFQEIVYFLFLPYIHNQVKLYQFCISSIASKFYKIPLEILSNLSFQSLKVILSNKEFKRPSEHSLFQLFIQDQSKYPLLEFVDFCKIDFKILQSFFEKLKHTDLNFQLFEQIKQLIYYQNQLIYQQNSPNSRKPEENLHFQDYSSFDKEPLNQENSKENLFFNTPFILDDDPLDQENSNQNLFFNIPLIFDNQPSNQKNSHKNLFSNNNFNLTTNISTDQYEIQNLLKRVSELKNQLSLEKAKSEKFFQQNLELQNQLSLERSKSEILFQQNPELFSQFSTEKLKSENLFQQNSELKNQLSFEKAKSEELFQENSELKDELSHYKTKINNLFHQNSDFEFQISKYQKENQNLSHYISNLEDQISEYKTKIEFLTQQNIYFSDQISNSKNEDQKDF
jgi:cell division protein FtsB